MEATQNWVKEQRAAGRRVTLDGSHATGWYLSAWTPGRGRGSCPTATADIHVDAWYDPAVAARLAKVLGV